MKQLRFIQWVLLWCCMLLPMHAMSAESTDSNNPPVFNPTAANKAFDQVTLKLSRSKLSVKRLNGAISKLSTMRERAQACVDNASKQVKVIDNQSKALFGKEGQDSSRVDSKYLLSQKEKLVDREAKCQLFVIRADEAIQAYRDSLLSMKQQITFTQGDNL